MTTQSILFLLFLIFAGSALTATIALYARQAIMLAYIAVGLICGPALTGLIDDTALIDDIAQVGIIFLLFLLGLSLEVKDLLRLFNEAVRVTALSCAAFFSLGYALAYFGGFNQTERLIVGAAMMFSSTIVALRLLPTSALHHQRMGEVIVAILLLQDLIAILILLFIQGLSGGEFNPSKLLPMLALPLIILAAGWFANTVLKRLMSQFDQIQEYLFLLTIGWCLGLAELSHALGLSHEIGAFVAGVSLATSPIARYLAETLKPLRDFFLIIFFFTLGAGFDIIGFKAVWPLAVALAASALVLKPVIFTALFKREHEKSRMAKEAGVRLGQISEFSLLLTVVAERSGLIGTEAALALTGASIMSFAVSSYFIVMRYPTPISLNPELRRD
ncbi:MAG: cation:proton antiporter [Gammaproteobacteria bacterium]|nr:cation:proton antiporter [Gammaproteobacteria bacterium]